MVEEEFGATPKTPLWAGVFPFQRGSTQSSTPKNFHSVIEEEE
jgi:hypothetical protein